MYPYNTTDSPCLQALLPPTALISSTALIISLPSLHLSTALQPVTPLVRDIYVELELFFTFTDPVTSGPFISTGEPCLVGTLNFLSTLRDNGGMGLGEYIVIG
jgi:hypothetical protein